MAEDLAIHVLCGLLLRQRPFCLGALLDLFRCLAALDILFQEHTDLDKAQIQLFVDFDRLNLTVVLLKDAVPVDLNVRFR